MRTKKYYLFLEDLMNILKNLFLINKKSEKNKDFSFGLVDQYIEIARLVKEARIQKISQLKNCLTFQKYPNE